LRGPAVAGVDIGMLQRMVAGAEQAQVAQGGRSALCMVMIVIDLAAVRGRATAGEPAVLVAGAEEALHPGCRNIVVRLDDHALWIEEDSVPTGCATGQDLGGLRRHG